MSSSELLATVSTVSQSIEENYSKIRFVLKLQKTSGTGGWNNVACPGSVTVDGQKKSFSSTYDLRNGAVTLFDKEFTVYHEANGSKTIKWSASFDGQNEPYVGSSTISGTYTPKTIPRASSFGTITSDTIGSTMTINIDRKATTFKHQMWYRLKDTGWVSIGENIDTSKSFTLPMTLCNQLPNSTSGTLDLCLRTYSGTKQIGSDVYKQVTVMVPSSVVPTISGVTVQENNALCQQLGVHVQMKSVLNVAIVNAAGAYGSTISKYAIECTGENSIYASSGQINGIKQSGQITIKGTVTDSRGRTASKQMTISVLPYALPKLTYYSASRVQSTLTEAYDSISTVVSASCSSLMVGSEKNKLVYRIDYRKANEPSYTSVNVPMSGIAINDFVRTITNISKLNSYFVRFSISDYFGEYIQSPEVGVGTGDIILHRCKDGVGIKKYWERGGLDVKGEIYSNDTLVSLNGHTHNNLIIKGNGKALATYDGGTAKTVDITPSAIGASASDHVHSYANKVLWSGAAYMNADQTITFSEDIGEQLHGVVFVWSSYDHTTHAPNNYDWHYFFVPKYHVTLPNSKGIYMCNSYCGMWKYVYVLANQAKGYSGNISTDAYNGIARRNDWVLRYVIGV